MIHDLADHEIALGIAGCGRRGGLRDDGARFVLEDEVFAEVGEVTLVVSLDEESFSAPGGGGAIAEGRDVRAQIEAIGGGNDGAAAHGVDDSAFESPSRDIEIIGVRILDLDILLILVSGERIVDDAAEGDGGIGWLRCWNAGPGSTFAFGDGKIRDARVEILALDAVIGLQEGIGGAGEVRAAAPLGPVLSCVQIDLPDQLVDPVMEVSAGQVLIDQGADAAIEHGLGARVPDDYFEKVVVLSAVQNVRPRPDVGMAGGRVAEDHGVGVERVGPEAEIEVPGEHRPLAAPFGVSVEVVVLVAAIDVLRDAGGGHVVDLAGQIDVVEEKEFQASAG